MTARTKRVRLSSEKVNRGLGFECKRLKPIINNWMNKSVHLLENQTEVVQDCVCVCVSTYAD